MLRKMLLAISAICAWTGVAVAEPVEIWLGLSGCDRTRMPFRLTVMEDGAIRLSGEFTARTLAGTFTTDAVALAHAAWLSDRAPPGETQFGLVGNVDRDAGLMVGTVEGLEHCPAFVAKRIELPPPAQAPALLAKVAPVRNARDTLSMEDCEAYFSWLADGKFIAPAGKGPRVNTALADQARMQAVLGADIYRWRIENRNQIKKLAACRQKFNRSGDPRHKALLQAAQRNGGVVPAPLAQDPNGRGGGQWIFAFMAAHPDIFEELEHLLRLAAAAPDSVLAQSPSAPKGGASPEAAEPAPTAREWVGVLSCGRGGDRYLRVTQSEKGVVVTTGPGLFNLAAPASLLMAGRVTEGQFDLDPTAWLERSNSVLGRAKPIALRATGEAELRLIHGKVEGDADCETFRAYLQTPADLPISPVGILFQSRVDDAACTALGRWLAAGEVDRIGGFRFNTLILDEKAIVEVLGKPLHLWTNDDVNTFRRMTSECRGRLTQSATIEDSTLAGAIEDWTVKPLSTLVSPGRPTDWMHLDLIRVMGDEADRRSQDRIESAKALPAVFESLSRIDAWNAETERGTGELAYLRQSARLDHLAQMAEIRRMLASRIAADELARLAAYPATLEGLQDAERIKNETGARLEAYNALVAARELAAGFADMAAEKGLVVWRDFLRINTPRVVELAEADYRAFGEIRELDHTEDALMRFARPHSAPSTGNAYRAYRGHRDNAVEAMVAASLSGLLEWIEAVPLTNAGLQAAENMLAETFPGGVRSPAARALQEAIAKKRSGYNPAGYFRPDFVYGLMRGHWSDIDYRGLENLAYFSTLLHQLRRACPQEVSVNTGSLTAYVLRGAKDAMDRLKRGEVKNRTEAQRALLLLLNLTTNQPGCKVDFFGNPTNNCTTQEDFAAATQLLMTSFPALSDVRKLLAGGCGDQAVSEVASGASRFVGLHPFSGGVSASPIPAIDEFL